LDYKSFPIRRKRIGKSLPYLEDRAWVLLHL
jgi:hypothetical protein